MLYANRDTRSSILADEVEALAAAYPDRFGLTHHLDAESGHPDEPRVRAWLTSVAGTDASTTAQFYVCGPTPFMDLAESALDRLGVPATQRFRERFAAAPRSNPVRATGSAGSAPTARHSPGSEAPGRRSLRVLMDGQAHEIACRSDETLLAAARRAGVTLPSSCEEGYCGCCIARLVEGEVHMDEHDALTAADIEQGLVLPCQARPKGAAIAITYEQ